MTGPTISSPTSTIPTKKTQKQYIPQFGYVEVDEEKMRAKTTKVTYMESAKNIVVDKGTLQSEVCANIVLGLVQVKEGIKNIKSKKDSLSDDDWDSDSDESYKEYVDNFLTYMTEVSGFFEALSKRIVNDAEVFEELNEYISNVISSGGDISNWR